MLKADKLEILPKKWYNIIPDLPVPISPPRDGKSDSSAIELLNKIIPKEVLRQEFTSSRFENIPDEVLEQYLQIGRPTPVIRAINLEKHLKFDGKIFFKYEGATATGSHKINTAIPQAYYAANEGISEITTETGAGQWGTATALAASLNGMRSNVFMVKVSHDQKPLRRTIMNLYGANVFSSPSLKTEYGRQILEKNKNHPGSLGIAISEAVQYALDHDYRYLLGSVMNSVITHQSIIGQETKAQLADMGIIPDVLIGCVGGGSNFCGFTYPLIGDKNIEMIASAATEVPKFSKGEFRYDNIDTAGILPQLKMLTLGSDYVPEGIYSGGLRYHGVAPSLSLLIKNGRIKTSEVSEDDSREAMKVFSRTQGFIPAPESAHAIATAMAYASDPSNRGKNIVINVSGHGLMDLSIFGDGKV